MQVLTSFGKAKSAARMLRTGVARLCCLAGLVAFPAVSQAWNDGGKPVSNERFVVTVSPQNVDAEHMHGFDPCACGADGAMMILTQSEIDRLGVPHRVVESLKDHVRRFRPERTMATVGVPSIAKLLDEPVPAWPPQGGTAGVTSLTYNRYHTPQEGIDLYHSLATQYPHVAKIQSIGTSVEGRDIWALRVSDNPNLDEPGEQKILFCGLHHAREWVTHEMMLYLAERLVTGYDTDPRMQRVVDNSVVWLVLAVNPDGFEYTWTDDRYWRKNRRLVGEDIGPEEIDVYGVDLNRNYDYNWGPGFNGSSGNIFSETYRGPSAASEPETLALQALLAAENPAISITYHTYSQAVLYPWGFTGVLASNAYSSLRSIGEKYTSLVKSAHGFDYIQGPTNYTLYTTNGDFGDYAYAVHGTLAYTPEMRPATSDLGNFNLPEDQILANCEENLASAMWLMNNVADARAVDIPVAEQLAPGENYFSIAQTPVNQNPVVAYGMTDAAANHLFSWLDNLYHPEPGFFTFPADFEGVGAGVGYLFVHNTESAEWADGFESYEVLPHVFDGGAVVLIKNLSFPGANYVGIPFDKPIRLADVSIIRRTVELSGNTYGQVEVVLARRTAIQDATSVAPWINWRWTHRKPDGSTQASHPSDNQYDPLVYPFRAYQFTSNVPSYSFDELEDSYALIFPEPVRADVNSDGVAGLADHALFAGCQLGPADLNVSESCRPMDFDHDLDVDTADFQLIQRQFGRTQP